MVAFHERYSLIFDYFLLHSYSTIKRFSFFRSFEFNLQMKYFLSFIPSHTTSILKFPQNSKFISIFNHFLSPLANIFHLCHKHSCISSPPSIESEQISTIFKALTLKTACHCYFFSPPSYFSVLLLSFKE